MCYKTNLNQESYMLIVQIYEMKYRLEKDHKDVLEWSVVRTKDENIYFKD